MHCKWIVFLLVIASLLSSCNSQNPITPTSPSTKTSATPILSSTETPIAKHIIPEHRISIRMRAHRPEFYDRKTNERFIPIGANFHMLGLENNAIVDRLFARYDPNQVAHEMDDMKSLGYTVIRTSLDLCQQDCIGKEGGGLRDDYLDNVVDFLRQAKAHGLFVIITSNDLPFRAGYIPPVEATCCSTFDGYINSHYLSSVGVEQWKKYWQDVLQALIARQAPLDAIMAYQIRGELFLFPDKPPLSLTSGTVTTANGKTYDMSDPAQKQLMLDEGLNYWADTVTDAIRQLDPTALTVIGLFPPNEPNIWREDLNRYVPTLPVFANSHVDFLDLHPYPGYVPLDQLMENFKAEGFVAKPLVIGEFGGFKFVYDSPQAAAQDLQRWQVDSCQYGIQGWMFWHWTGTDDLEVWTGSDGDGAIRQVLAPHNRPDPCVANTFDFLETNLALNKPVTASRSLNENPPAFAVDGLNSTSWISGDGPSQWIEIDLEKPTTIDEIQLVISQYPDGETTHQIFVSGEDRQFQLLHEFRGATKDSEALVYTLPQSISGIRYIKIITLQSPSWVAWREIEIINSQ